MGAQLLGRVVIEQVERHGRLHGAGAGGLGAHEEDVVVGHGHALLEVPAQGVPQGRLRHAVEVDVVLADELELVAVLAAPPVAPVVAGVAAAAPLGVEVEHGLGERDGRPQALGPAPGGEALHAVHDGGGHAPLDVARDAEGQQGLARAEAHAGGHEGVAGLVAGLPVGKRQAAGAFAVGLGQLVGGQGRQRGVERLAHGGGHVDDGGQQPLGDRGGHHGAHALVALLARDLACDEVVLGGQVEVPVVHRAQLGGGAGELGDGVDELLGLELVAQVALVGVGLLGLAALHGAEALHLAAVEELPRLHVVELLGGAKRQGARLVQALLDLGGEGGMVARGGLKGAAGEDVQRDVVGLERLLLVLVVRLHVVDDCALVAFLGDLLAVALHDGRAVAVGARHEHDVGGADAVAQEARVEVGGHEDARDVAEVQVLVAIGHAAGHDGAFREVGALTSVGHEDVPAFLSYVGLFQVEQV